MAKKFNEVINEFLRIYGGETEFIRALREKNAELIAMNASDDEADEALQELMSTQLRRINRSSLSDKSGTQSGMDKSDTSDNGEERDPDTPTLFMTDEALESVTYGNGAAKRDRDGFSASVLTRAQESLKEYFDSHPRKARYSRSYDTEDSIAFSCTYILDNTIKLPVRILLERLSDTHTCTIYATLPLTVSDALVYPMSKKLLEINAASPEPVGAFYLGQGEDTDLHTVYFKYTFIIDKGLEISDFEKYFNSICRSVLKYYDDILMCSRGHFKSSELREIASNINRLENTIGGASL